MRILFWGDLAATGFGTVTTDLGRALLDRGEDVRFVSMNEDGHTLVEPFASRTTVLGGKDGWLGEVPRFHSDQERETWAAFRRDTMRSLFTGAIENGWIPDATVVVGDPASLYRSGIADLIPDGLAAYHYVPIEGVGLPPSWAALWEKLQPIAMCSFGADEIEKLTGRRPPFVYHGVAPDFYPVSPARPIMLERKREWLRSKDDCKRHLGISPEATVLFRADRFVPRKRYPSMLRAAARVMLAHPDVVLLLHCRTIDDGGNLADFCSHLPPSVVARIRSTGVLDAGLIADRKLLNIMYNAADLYLSTAAEGFGLTIAESLAAGTPAVGMDFSAVPEVIGAGGVVAPVGYYVENEYAYYWANVNEPAFAEKVEHLVASPRERRLLAAKAPLHARTFSWPRAAEQFVEIMARPVEIAA